MFFWSSDISALLKSQPPRAAVCVDDGLMEAAAQGAPQGTAKHAVVVAAVTSVLLLIIIIIRRTRRRQQDSDQAVIVGTCLDSWRPVTVRPVASVET